VAGRARGDRPDGRIGEFYGPDSILAGRPRLASAPRSSARAAFGARLWSEAEERSGIRFEVRAGAVIASVVSAA